MLYIYIYIELRTDIQSWTDICIKRIYAQIVFAYNRFLLISDLLLISGFDDCICTSAEKSVYIRCLLFFVGFFWKERIYAHILKCVIRCFQVLYPYSTVYGMVRLFIVSVTTTPPPRRRRRRRRRIYKRVVNIVWKLKVIYIYIYILLLYINHHHKEDWCVCVIQDNVWCSFVVVDAITH
jgi:hypothetical protein